MYRGARLQRLFCVKLIFTASLGLCWLPGLTNRVFMQNLCLKLRFFSLFWTKKRIHLLK